MVNALVWVTFAATRKHIRNTSDEEHVYVLQAGRGTTRKQLEWLIIHNRLQYIADVLCSCENFVLAFDLASDPDLPLAGPPVLLRWAQAVIDLLGTDSAACLAWLRKRLDAATGVDWATVAGYALVRSPDCDS